MGPLWMEFRVPLKGTRKCLGPEGFGQTQELDFFTMFMRQEGMRLFRSHKGNGCPEKGARYTQLIPLEPPVH